jgi:hypothetical protein
VSESHLHLTLDQARLLILSVQICQQLDTAALAHTDVQRTAASQIREREGEAGIARLDQALALARDRLPKLQALIAVLIEHVASLEGEQDEK